MHQKLSVRRLAPPLRKDIRIDESNMAIEGIYLVGHSCRRISFALHESEIVSAEDTESLIRCHSLGKKFR